MFRRLSTFVGGAPSVEIPVEYVTIEVLAGKVSIQEDFDPVAVWVTLTVLTNSNVNSPQNVVYSSKRCEKQIRLQSSYLNQWKFRDKFKIPKNAKVLVELRGHFDETNAFGGVLLGDATISASSLSTLSTDIEMERKDFTAALNVTSSDFGRSAISAIDSERSLTNANGGDGTSASASASSLGKCTVTLRLKYVEPKDPALVIANGGVATSSAVAPPSKKNSTSRPGHVTSLGKLSVTLWQGKNINTSCPVYVTLALATFKAKGYRTPVRPNPHNPVFDFMVDLDVYSLQADLIVEVWEEQMSGANKLGQTIIPISWLLQKATVKTLCGYNKPTGLEVENEMSISSWFEIFPPATPTPFNNGGQYRPYYKGLPMYGTGYGLMKPDKSMGFLKMDLQLNLRESFALTFVRNPWNFAPRDPEPIVDEEEFALKAILVAAFTMVDIFNYLWDPPILKKLFDILNWKTHAALSFVVLLIFSYLALIASPWQYPFIILILTIIIGLAAAMDRNFDDVNLFPEDSRGKGKSGEEEKEKSYTELYKEMKVTALSMEKSVSLAYSVLTKGNNLLMWSDPILSGITFIILAVLAVCISLMLCVFSPNQVFWFGGLSFFTPPELQDYITVCVFQQMAKMQEWVLSAFTRKKPQTDSSGESSESKERQHSTERVSKMKSQDKLEATNEGNPGPATQLDLYDSDDEIEEFEAFDPNKLFSYNWMKEQTYKWLLMTPDDTELRHRHICTMAVVTKDQLMTRLPVKRKQVTSTSSDLITSIMGGSSQKSSSMSGYMSAWIKSSTASISMSKKSSSSARNLRLNDDEQDDDDSRLLHRNSHYSVADSELAAALDIPRTLGELFPQKTKPIVITVGNPQAPATDGSKAFRVSVSVIAARNLGVKESVHKSIGSMAAVRSKIYADVSIQPSSACNTFFRTGGQPKGPNPQFREDFEFESVGDEAMFLVVEITRKSAIQTRGMETFLGQMVVSFEAIVDTYLNMHPGDIGGSSTGQVATSSSDSMIDFPGEVRDWFPLIDKATGQPMGNAAAVNLSILISSAV